ncbi:DUF397 domain-containing protein [Streptomyces sp. NBC_00996]|uniref:DUF397 domain-containing protein n=1 Tax=Streptomyces sp. NBC_00996 TaxID=2903710 RepID=UPI00386CE4EE|nr:DUF397 domain-containing protein [Streptomyces sp. NBC_00996]
MPELQWIKSSFSEASGNNCVEIADNDHHIAVRDSKHPELPWASVGREAWAHFTGAVAEGQLA